MASWKTRAEELGIEDQILKDLKDQAAEEDKIANAQIAAEQEEVISSNNYDRLQIVEACRTQLNFLAALVIPHTFEVMFSPTHLTAWQILIDTEADKSFNFPQIALGIPRGHAKTTLLKLFVVWCILFSKRKFFLIVSSIEQHSLNFMSDIAAMLDEDNIRAVFGYWKNGMEIDTRGLKKFGFQGRGIIIYGIGAEGSVRGTNLGNNRPDMMIMDDIQSKENADSPVMSAVLMEWMVGTLMKSKSPSGCMFLFAGNMFAAQGSILKKIKRNPTWLKFISGAILADGTALWPEVRSLESLIEELDNDIAFGQAHIFFAEVMNDTDTGINSTVDYSKFPVWPWTKSDLPQGKFLLVDPSQGKGMDADVIATVEVYDAKIGIRAVHEAHYSPRNLILKALIIAVQADIYCIAIESMAYQSTLLFWFDEICREIGISGISFVPIYTTTVSKNSRISGGIKAMQTHEIYLHGDVRSMVQRQIADWNPMKRDNKDDILDVIANAQKVLADYTYDIMVKGSLIVMEAGSATVVEDNHAF